MTIVRVFTLFVFLSLFPEQVRAGCSFSGPKNKEAVPLKERYKDILDVPKRYERTIEIGGAMLSPHEISKMDPRVFAPMGREKLLALVSKVLFSARMHEEDDTEEEIINKYFASVTVTAVSMNTLMSSLSSPIAWFFTTCGLTLESDRQKDRRGFLDTMRRQNTKMANLFPRPHGDFIYCRILGQLYGWEKYKNMDALEAYIIEKGWNPENTKKDNIPEIIELAIDYFLASIVVDGFDCWRIDNTIVLNKAKKMLPTLTLEEVEISYKHVQRVMNNMLTFELFSPYAREIKGIIALLSLGGARQALSNSSLFNLRSLLFSTFGSSPRPTTRSTAFRVSVFLAAIWSSSPVHR